MLPLFAALEEIAQSQIELCGLVHIVRVELIHVEKWQKLRVTKQHRIRTKIGRYLLSLALRDRRASREQSVIVLQRSLNGFIQRNFHRPLRLREGSRRRRWRLRLINSLSLCLCRRL